MLEEVWAIAGGSKGGRPVVGVAARGLKATTTSVGGLPWGCGGERKKKTRIFTWSKVMVCYYLDAWLIFIHPKYLFTN